MRPLLAAAFLLSLMAAGCSTSPCQHLSNAAQSASTKAAPCNSADGGTTMNTVNSVAVNTCESSCSSSSDSNTIDSLASCLDSLPTCDPNNSGTFSNALLACALGTGSLSQGCQAAFNSGSTTGGDM